MATDFQQVCARAAALSLTDDYKGCAVHVNARILLQDGAPVIAGYVVSDWYGDATCCTYVNGERT